MKEQLQELIEEYKRKIESGHKGQYFYSDYDYERHVGGLSALEDVVADLERILKTI